MWGRRAKPPQTRTPAMACLKLDLETTLIENLEEQRLAAVYATGLLDTEHESEYDELAKLAAAICGTPIGAISLLDERRQWFKAIVGLDVKETPRELSFCDHAIRQAGLFIVEDARRDARFAANPFVNGPGGIAFYAGMPLRNAAGHALGALCVVDQQPRNLTAQQQNGLRVLARQVMAWIDLRAQKKALAEALAEKDKLTAWLAEYQKELEEANDRLRSLAATDELTGLKNRRAFEERLVYEFALARRNGRALSIAILDADNFKKINDDLGHPAGDAVLQMLSYMLRSMVRETDLAVRFGGEEFAVILPDTDESNALSWCTRLQEALAASNRDRRRVTLSVGAAALTPWCGEPAHLVRRADEALYAAKARGKNCAVGASQLVPTLSPERKTPMPELELADIGA
jgi:diguanylate cyclase (GGDEF)-like protein